MKGIELEKGTLKTRQPKAGKKSGKRQAKVKFGFL
jgi:hypothetical protein